MPETIQNFANRVGLQLSSLEENGFCYAIELVDIGELDFVKYYNISRPNAKLLHRHLQDLKLNREYEVVQFFKSINMNHYLKNVLNLSVHNLNDLFEKSDRDFLRCGIQNAQHRALLLQHIKQEKQIRREGSKSINAMFDGAYKRLEATLSYIVNQNKTLHSFVSKLQNVDLQMVELLKTNKTNCMSSLSKTIVEQLQTNTAKIPTISVFGDVKAGKSSVINCILGKQIVATDFKPCTSMISLLTYSNTPQIMRYTKEGKQEVISLNQHTVIPSKLLDIDGDNRQDKLQYTRLEIQMDIELLKYVHIVDTPGLNENGELDKHIFEHIKQSDAFIFVINASSTITKSLLDLIDYVGQEFDKKGLSIPRVFVLVNKMNTLSKSLDPNLVLDFIAEQFQKLFPQLESKKKNEYIHGISADEALECLKQMRKPDERFGNAFNEIIKLFEETSKDKLNDANNIINSYYNKIKFSVESIGSVKNLTENEKQTKFSFTIATLNKLRNQVSKVGTQCENEIRDLENWLKKTLQEYWTSNKFKNAIINQNFEESMDDCTRAERIAEFMKKELTTLSNSLVQTNFKDLDSKICKLYKQANIGHAIESAFCTMASILKVKEENISINSVPESAYQLFSNSKFHELLIYSTAENINTSDNGGVKKVLFQTFLKINIGFIFAHQWINKYILKNNFSLEDAIVKEYSSTKSLETQASRLVKCFRTEVHKISSQLNNDINDALNICERIKTIKNIDDKILQQWNECESGHSAMIGTLINHTFIDYSKIKVLAPIGKGNFALVKAGIVNGEDIAIKEISNDKKLAIAEAYMLYLLRHDNIIRYIGFTKNDTGNYCIITKKYETNLQQGLQFLNLKQKQQVLFQIVTGMLYLHRRDIMHRDLKLENILLTKDNDAVIADFGLAKNSSTAGSACGTLDYMAPEIKITWGQTKYQCPYTKQADVYSFGVLGLKVLESSYANDCIWQILKECLNESAESRPTFEQLFESFHEILTEKEQGQDLNKSMRLKKQNMISLNEEKCKLVPTKQQVPQKAKQQTKSGFWSWFGFGNK